MASRLKKNNTLSLKDKCKLVDQYEIEGKNVQTLVKLWKVSKSTVCEIIKQKDKYQAEAAKKGFGTRKRVIVPKYDAIEKQLFRNFQEARRAKPNLPIDATKQ